jgi:hypothetical protein
VNLIQSLKAECEDKHFYSVKQIFEDNWHSYLGIHNVRDIEKKEVENMLSCKGQERGCFVCYCKKCDRYEIIPFGCNSRLCSCCGKRYTDKWANMLANRIFAKVVHRHLVFTLPSQIWNFVKENRSLQKIIMDAVYQTIKELFVHISKKDITPGVIEVLHPFGKDLVFKPHVHCIATEGGYTQEGEFVQLGQYINYNSFHKKWQYNLLTALRRYIPPTIIDFCFRRYKEGFVVYIKPERIHSKKRLAQYIGRYVRHPAIANSRIVDYNGDGVTFYYSDHDNRRAYKTIPVFDFISAIIQHVPEENQRLVRYYGAYSRNCLRKVIRKSSIRQSILSNFENNKEKRVFYCSVCREVMEFIAYLKPPPKKDMNLITNWID